MTSISKTIYASGAEIEVGKKSLTTGDYVQLKISYDKPEEDRGVDVFVVTLSAETARKVAQDIIDVL